MDGNFSFNFCTYSPEKCRPDRLHGVVHDLRLGGQPQPAENRDPGAEPPGREVQAGVDRVADLAGQEQAHHAGGLPGERLAGRRGPADADSRIREHLQHLLPALQAQRRDGLRRPALADEHPAARLPRRAGALPGAVPVYSGRRVPGHELCAVRHHPAAVAAPLEGVRRGRRRAVDLLVPRGEDREHPLVPQRLPRCAGLQAGTELPLDADDRRGGQLGDRAQREAHGEEVLFGGGAGRQDPHPESLYRP